MNNITIEVQGKVKTGKSSIMKIIQDALKEKGFSVEVTDPDYDDFNAVMEARPAAHIEKLAKNTQITIKQLQLFR